VLTGDCGLSTTQGTLVVSGFEFGFDLFELGEGEFSLIR